MEFDIIYVNGDKYLMNLPIAPEGVGLTSLVLSRKSSKV
jgi:hypothetical protein